MKKLEKIVTKTLDTVKGRCVDVFGYVLDDQVGEVTLGCDVCGDKEMAMMCYGWINPEDPAGAPSKDYASREEAENSEYGEQFAKMFEAAAKALMRK